MEVSGTELSDIWFIHNVFMIILYPTSRKKKTIRATQLNFFESVLILFMPTLL